MRGLTRAVLIWRPLHGLLLFSTENSQRPHVASTRNAHYALLIEAPRGPPCTHRPLETRPQLADTLLFLPLRPLSVLNCLRHDPVLRSDVTVAQGTNVIWCSAVLWNFCSRLASTDRKLHGRGKKRTFLPELLLILSVFYTVVQRVHVDSARISLNLMYGLEKLIRSLPWHANTVLKRDREQKACILIVCIGLWVCLTAFILNCQTWI